MKPLLISIPEFCAIMGIKRTKANELIKAGEVQSAKIGRRRLIYRKSAEALAERSMVEES